jgi:hypothetical protein
MIAVGLIRPPGKAIVELEGVTEVVLIGYSAAISSREW